MTARGISGWMADSDPLFTLVWLTCRVCMCWAPFELCALWKMHESRLGKEPWGSRSALAWTWEPFKCVHTYTHTHIQTGLHRAHAQQQVFLKALIKEQKIRRVSYTCRGFNFNIGHLHFHFNFPNGCTIYCFYTFIILYYNLFILYQLLYL